jgi:hypothetical protein
MTKKKPKVMPILNWMLFLKPFRLALDIAMILLGPGVKVVTRTYDIKAAKFGMDIYLPTLV